MNAKIHGYLVLMWHDGITYIGNLKKEILLLKGINITDNVVDNEGVRIDEKGSNELIKVKLKYYDILIFKFIFF